MQPSVRDDYLANQVLTAAPQKLHQIALDAAIRAAELARAKWQAGDDIPAHAEIDRAQEIVGQLLAGLDREAAPELVKRVAAVYLFVFRCLMDANHHRDEKKLDEAIRVLEVERETWRQVCDKLGTEKSPDAATDAVELSPPSSPGIPLLDVPSDLPAGLDSSLQGFSLDA